jgi:RNA polymerase sigma-70 factor (ECF subfamily)
VGTGYGLVPLLQRLIAFVFGFVAFGHGVSWVNVDSKSLRSSQGASDQESPTADFVALLETCQRPIFLYAMALLGNVDDAEEVVQESGLVLWKKFSEYQPGTDFVRWACQIARYQSLKVRARRFRGPQVFSNEFLAMFVAATEEKSLEQFEAKRQVLLRCMQKLSTADRDLIVRRYRKGTSTRDVAAALNRSVQGTRRSLQRIREALARCARIGLAQEDKE